MRRLELRPREPAREDVGKDEYSPSLYLVRGKDPPQEYYGTGFKPPRIGIYEPNSPGD